MSNRLLSLEIGTLLSRAEECKRGDPGKAVEYFDRLTRSPYKYRLTFSQHGSLAFALMKIGKLSRAVTHIKKSIQMQSRITKLNPTAENIYAQILWRQGKHMYAIERLQGILELFPEDVYSLGLIAEVYLDIGDLDLARKAALDATQYANYAQKFVAYSLLANILTMCGDLPGAEMAALQAKEIRVDRRILLQYAEILRKQKRYPEAICVLDELSRLAQPCVEQLLCRAYCLMSMQQPMYDVAFSLFLSVRRIYVEKSNTMLFSDQKKILYDPYLRFHAGIIFLFESIISSEKEYDFLSELYIYFAEAKKYIMNIDEKQLHSFQKRDYYSAREICSHYDIVCEM